MTTFFIAIGSFLGFIVAYNTYGRWIARKVFGLDPSALVPSKELEDGVDYVPSKRSIVFGHHFTSIAGTGPIVGPAIAVFWGWLPALLWVVFGSIFIGAVHDFSALIISMRNRGQTVGEIAGRMISPRTTLLFLLALFFALTVVLAIFGFGHRDHFPILSGLRSGRLGFTSDCDHFWFNDAKRFDSIASDVDHLADFDLLCRLRWLLSFADCFAF